MCACSAAAAHLQRVAPVASAAAAAAVGAAGGAAAACRERGGGGRHRWTRAVAHVTMVMAAGRGGVSGGGCRTHGERLCMVVEAFVTGARWHDAARWTWC